MSGYVEMLLQLLDSGALSMEESFRLAYYTMENGTKPALQNQLGIDAYTNLFSDLPPNPSPSAAFFFK
jgi:hypothetical protein